MLHSIPFLAPWTLVAVVLTAAVIDLRTQRIPNWLVLPTLICDAEKLPFPDNYFDRVSVAFGLRNMTHKESALAEMLRVTKTGFERMHRAERKLFRIG